MVTFIEFEFGADVRNAISFRCMSYWDEVARKSWNERHFDSLHAQEGYYLFNWNVKEVTAFCSRLSCKLILIISVVIVLLLSHFSRLFFSTVVMPVLLGLANPFFSGARKAIHCTHLNPSSLCLFCNHETRTNTKPRGLLRNIQAQIVQDNVISWNHKGQNENANRICIFSIFLTH